jgi:hypothetical protein
VLVEELVAGADVLADEQLAERGGPVRPHDEMCGQTVDEDRRRRVLSAGRRDVDAMISTHSAHRELLRSELESEDASRVLPALLQLPVLVCPNPERNGQECADDREADEPAHWS